MKVTIQFEGNSLGDLFDVCQGIADATFDEKTAPEDIDFTSYRTKPTVEVEYDPEDYVWEDEPMTIEDYLADEADKEWKERQS
jgi:hypothetical protein